MSGDDLEFLLMRIAAESEMTGDEGAVRLGESLIRINKTAKDALKRVRYSTNPGDYDESWRATVAGGCNTLLDASANILQGTPYAEHRKAIRSIVRRVAEFEKLVVKGLQ